MQPPGRRQVHPAILAVERRARRGRSGPPPPTRARRRPPARAAARNPARPGSPPRSAGCLPRRRAPRSPPGSRGAPAAPSCQAIPPGAGAALLDAHSREAPVVRPPAQETMTRTRPDAGPHSGTVEPQRRSGRSRLLTARPARPFPRRQRPAGAAPREAGAPPVGLPSRGRGWAGRAAGRVGGVARRMTIPCEPFRATRARAAAPDRPAHALETVAPDSPAPSAARRAATDRRDRSRPPHWQHSRTSCPGWGPARGGARAPGRARWAARHPP